MAQKALGGMFFFRDSWSRRLLIEVWALLYRRGHSKIFW
jgi:hypothetical protein